jgi:hypothetical protein
VLTIGPWCITHDREVRPRVLPRGRPFVSRRSLVGDDVGVLLPAGEGLAGRAEIVLVSSGTQRAPVGFDA